MGTSGSCCSCEDDVLGSPGEKWIEMVTKNHFNRLKEDGDFYDL